MWYYYLNVQVNPQLAPTEPLGAVAVQTDHVLPRHVRGEGELALAAVHLGQDDLVVRVSDLNMHPCQIQLIYEQPSP